MFADSIYKICLAVMLHNLYFTGFTLLVCVVQGMSPSTCMIDNFMSFLSFSSVEGLKEQLLTCGLCYH